MILLFLSLLVIIISFLIYMKNCSPFQYTQDIILIFFASLCGLFFEMIFVFFGIVQYLHTTLLIPLLAALSVYPLISLILKYTVKKIKLHPVFNFTMGFSFAFLILSFDLHFQLIALNYPFILTWIILGAIWTAFIFLAEFLATAIEQAVSKTWDEKDNKTILKLFYDGSCSICEKEICQLQKQNKNKSIKFIDIVSKEDFSKEAGPLDYETAMSQMHALDDQGNLLIGLDAFAKAYARSNWLIRSAILNIPFLRVFLDPLYRLFARYRR